MKKALSIFISLLLILSCAACGPKAPEAPPAPPSDTVVPDAPKTPDVSTPHDSTPPAQSEVAGSATPPQKILLNGQVVAYDEFPIPTADTFSLTGDDASLYEAAVSLFNYQACPGYFSEGSSDLILPVLTQYGKYETDDGNATFVINFTKCFFYDLGSGLNDMQAPVYTGSYLNNLAVITLDKGGNLVSYDEDRDGTSYDEFSRFVREICGPMTDLAEKIIEDGGLPEDGERQVPGAGSYEEILQQYLEYYFER